MNNEACRKAFEELLNPIWSINRDKDGKYKSKTVESHWKTWQAAYNHHPDVTERAKHDDLKLRSLPSGTDLSIYFSRIGIEAIHSALTIKSKDEDGRINDALGILDKCQIIPLFVSITTKIKELEERNDYLSKKIQERHLDVEALTAQIKEMRDALEMSVDDLDTARGLLCDPIEQHRVARYRLFTINRVLQYRSILAKYPKEKS